MQHAIFAFAPPGYLFDSEKEKDEDSQTQGRTTSKERRSVQGTVDECAEPYWSSKQEITVN
jgi:hypothetical protein